MTLSGLTTTSNFAYEGLLLKNLAASQSGGVGATSWEITYLYDENGRPYAGVYRQPANTTSPVVFGMVTTDRGDVVELVDAAGNPFAAYRYDAWGNPQGTGNVATGVWSQGTTPLISDQVASDIASRQVLRYASYCYDSESGLYYLSARSYDPQTRQFLSKDEAKADGEESEYQYCGGDPVGGLDPSGCTIIRVTFPEVGSYYATTTAPTTIAIMRYNAGYLIGKLANNKHKYGRVIGWCETFYWWYNMVKGGGQWDLKHSSGGPADLDKPYMYFWADTPSGYTHISKDDFGNLNFGFTGAALGLDKPMLCAGSFAANFKDNVIPSYLKGAFNSLLKSLKNEVCTDEPMACWGVDLFRLWGGAGGTVCFVR